MSFQRKTYLLDRLAVATRPCASLSETRLATDIEDPT
jgi:hypothetical protein